MYDKFKMFSWTVPSKIPNLKWKRMNLGLKLKRNIKLLFLLSILWLPLLILYFHDSSDSKVNSNCLKASVSNKNPENFPRAASKSWCFSKEKTEILFKMQVSSFQETAFRWRCIFKKILQVGGSHALFDTWLIPKQTEWNCSWSMWTERWIYSNY
jgi:hypothetical protein